MKLLPSALRVSGALLGVLCVGAPSLSAEGLSGWRFWDASDGLYESYSRVLGRSLNGSLWVHHGAVRYMSILDGYCVRRVGDPRTGDLDDFSKVRPVWADAEENGWTAVDNSLWHTVSGRWAGLGRGPAGEPVLDAIPTAWHTVLVCFPDRVAEYHPGQHRYTNVEGATQRSIGEIRSMARGFSGDILVAGSHGVGKLSPDASRRSFVWTYSNAASVGLRKLEHALPGENGEVFVAGVEADGSRSVVRWDAGGLSRVFSRSRHTVRAWRGPDHAIYVLESNSIFRLLPGDRKEFVAREGPLATMVYDILPERSGAFWVATSSGLAHYAPQIWRTPPAIAAFDRPVHAVVEDHTGKLWFAATDNLLELDGDRWTIHSLPAGVQTHSLQTEGFAELADGRLAVKVVEEERADGMLLFDPKAGRFSKVPHPDGRVIQFLGPRKDGALWVRTTPGFHLEVFDGRSFRPVLDLTRQWNAGSLRQVLETGDGGLLLAGTSGCALYRDGHYHEFGPADGFDETAVFRMTRVAPNRILATGRKSLMAFDGHHWSPQLNGVSPRVVKQFRNGSIWMTSSAGIYRFQDGAWTCDTDEDGLPSSAVFNVFEDSRKRIWVGTSHGLSLYHAEADVTPPRTLLDDAADTSPSHQGSNPRIYFSGVDEWKQTVTDRLLFAYRLDDGPWSEFRTQRFAAFSELRAGRHRLEVRAMDRNGNQERIPESFAFSVEFPWYRQPVFLAVAVAGVIAIVVLLWLAVLHYRYRGRLVVELDQARRAAESASRYKSEFLASMSHEIRTPMNAIIGMTQLAIEDGPGPHQKEYLNAVASSADSLLGLLNDALDLSKVEAGRMELSISTFDLAKCVNDSVETLRIRAESKKLEMRTYVDPALSAWVSGDEQKLRQILVNLLGNAVKFTAAGTVRVDVLLRPKTGLGIPVEFVVRDTGPGISPEEQVLVFAPFQQSKKSNGQRPEGAGLGLSISRKLAALMGGTIWVESPWMDPESETAVRGSAFHLHLIFEKGEPVTAVVLEPSAVERPLRVLVAEDNTVNQVLAQRILTKRGHTVLLASNGEETLRLLQNDTVDLVLMDVQMPKLDGVEATAAIRKTEAATGAHLPIVALTAHAMEGAAERYRRAGMDGFVAKPIQVNELLVVIEQAMRLARPPVNTPPASA